MSTNHRLQSPHRRSAGSAAAGFTLVELLVTLAILVVVIVGVLALFDLNTRVARTQTHITEMQQSQRIAQQSILKLARMAGRGGLPLFDRAAGVDLPTGSALGVANNVGTAVTLGGCDCAQVLPGTDVLTLRGIFTAPIYLNDPLDAAAFSPPAGGTGSLSLKNRTPTGAPQPLEDLARVVRRAQSGDGSDAMLMVDTLGRYVVVEITGGATVPASGSPVTEVRVDFVADGGANTDDYTKLSVGGAYPANFDQVAFAGVLEEYQFYVRDRRTNPSSATEDPRPQLVRARFYPNTDKAYIGSDANLTEVVADDILDLQVALGVDTDRSGGILEGGPASTVTTEKDEWLFNDPADDPDPDKWNVASGDIFYIRVNTLARTDRPTPQYQADLLDTIEDKSYATSPFDRFNSRAERSHHRRVIRSIIDLRNL